MWVNFRNIRMRLDRKDVSYRTNTDGGATKIIVTQFGEYIEFTPYACKLIVNGVRFNSNTTSEFNKAIDNLPKPIFVGVVDPAIDVSNNGYYRCRPPSK